MLISFVSPLSLPVELPKGQSVNESCFYLAYSGYYWYNYPWLNYYPPSQPRICFLYFAGSMFANLTVRVRALHIRS